MDEKGKRNEGKRRERLRTAYRARLGLRSMLECMQHNSNTTRDRNSNTTRDPRLY